MPILGIVLTLDPDLSDNGRAVRERLRAVANLELGARQGQKQPAVLDCDRRSVDCDVVRSNDGVEAELESLRSIEGVFHLEVVFAEFADLLPDENSESLAPAGERTSRSNEPRIEMECKMEHEPWS